MPTKNKPQSCYLGLGSNLENPKRQLQIAIRHIDNITTTQFIQSAAWYQSKAWGITAQNDFINTVIEIQTSLTPLALLKAVKIIEYRLMQRQVNLKWHARKIDIDILLYGRFQINRKELCIPHPYIADRSFVYVPLLELQPQLPIALKKQLKATIKSNKNPTELRSVQR